MTLLGTLGSASTGTGKKIASIARDAYDGTKQTISATGKIIMSTPKSALGGIKDIFNPEELLTAAVGDNRLGQNIVKKIFDNKNDYGDYPNVDNNVSAVNSEDTSLTGEIIDKLVKIDDDIIDLKNSLVGQSKSIEKTIYDTTAAQTIILTKGDGYNIINDVVKTIFNPIGLPNGRQDKIVPSLPQLINHMPAISTTDISHNNVSEILDKEDDREDDQVAKQQADDIRAIRGYIETRPTTELSTTKEKSIIERVTDKLLDGGGEISTKRGRGRKPSYTESSPAKRMASRAGATIRALPATISNGMSATGSAVGNVTRPALSSIMSMGKGAMSTIGGLGAGTLAAGTSALLFGGTGLYSAYKASKGGDSSNWISNLVDKGVNYVSGDTNSTIGTKLYDILNSDESITNNIPTPGSIIKTPIQTPSIEPAKDKIISELISKQETNNTHTITASNSTMSTSAMTDKTSIIKEPEPLTDAKQLELNKIETEKEDRQQTDERKNIKKRNYTSREKREREQYYTKLAHSIKRKENEFNRDIEQFKKYLEFEKMLR